MGRASVPERPAHLDTVIILLERSVREAQELVARRGKHGARPRSQPALFELARHGTTEAFPWSSPCPCARSTAQDVFSPMKTR